MTYGENCCGQWHVIVYIQLIGGDQFGEATIWPIREHSVYELSATIISLEFKGGCQTGLWRGPVTDAPAKYKVSIVDCCCVKFLTAKITNNFNKPLLLSLCVIRYSSLSPLSVCDTLLLSLSSLRV